MDYLYLLVIILLRPTFLAMLVAVREPVECTVGRDKSHVGPGSRWRSTADEAKAVVDQRVRSEFVVRQVGPVATGADAATVQFGPIHGIGDCSSTHTGPDLSVWRPWAGSLLEGPLPTLKCYNLRALTIVIITKYTHNHSTALFWDYPGEPVPER